MDALRITLALACALTAACTKPSAADEVKLGAAGESASFAAGQRWSYAARPSEPSATFLVLKVEDDKSLGRIVHIRADGLRLKNDADPSGYSDAITHMPFSEAALRASAKARVGEAEPVPDFTTAYDTWRAAFSEENAGVFTTPLAEAVQVMENAINPG